MTSPDSMNLAQVAAGSDTNPSAHLVHPHSGKTCYRMSFRSYIDLLSQKDCLERVERLVDWKFELGEITRSRQVPLLFENIADYPGQRVFTNGLSNSSSMAIALGIPPAISWKSLIGEARRRATTPLEPVVVDAGAVLENIVEAPNIDLFRLPIPQWSRYDGGRYIGTWHANVTRDPVVGSRNLGVYRMQVLSRNQTTVNTSSNSHLFDHFAKAEAKGQPLEMAVVIGAPETVVMAAAAGYPRGSDEYDLAGGLSGEAIRLIKCMTVNLEVPAESEMVIEGVIKPCVRIQDGPYFDYAGKPTTNPKAFLFEATRLMYRNDPIFRGAAVGHPGAEDQHLFSLLSELNLFDFHDSRPRHQIQSRLIKGRLFRAFQLVGRASMPPFLRRTMKHLSSSS